MPKRCAYGICKSDTRYPRSVEGGVVFFPFPKPKTQEERCLTWIKNCGRPESQLNPSKINKNTFVCSKHFANGRPTPEEPDPVPAQPSPRRDYQKGVRKPTYKKSKRAEQDAARARRSNPTKETASACSDTDTDTEVHHTGYHEEDPKTLKDKVAEQKQDMVNVKMEPDGDNGQFKALGKEPRKEHKTNALTPESLNQSPEQNIFHESTGFTYDQFNSLCECFKVPTDPISLQTQIPLTYRTVDIEIQKMPLRSQFLLTLMKLRQNLDYRDLAVRFQIPLESVGTLINSWVDYMCDLLGQVSTWPHRDVILLNMPADFRLDFPRTFAILDCTELKLHKSSALMLQSQTNSEYCNTLKSLVICDPRGEVMYASTLFTGSLSDKEIFKECKVLELLQGCIQCGRLKVGDGLLADEDLLIQNELEEIGLKLKSPAFAKSKCQKMRADEDITQKFAKHRVNVERAIEKIKKFKIISDKITVSHLGNINQIWYVVSMLSNFQPHITDEK